MSSRVISIVLCFLLIASAGSYTVLASDVEKNTIDYELSFYSDFFDNETIHYTGAANYTYYKRVTSNSPYVYQSGTWVKNHKDRVMRMGSNNYWPGSKNHRIIIEESGDSASDLVIANERAYDDDDSSDIPEYVEYSFDVAWDLAKNYAPFYIPPQPDGLIVDDGEDTTVHTVSDTETRIEYNEGNDNGEQYTHSARWKWEFPSGVNSGWHWTKVDRQADNGYYQMDRNGFITWRKEADQQYGLGTSFCVYRDSKSQEC